MSDETWKWIDVNGKPYRISNPRHKRETKYLDPNAWHGDPVPDGRLGPWALGQECWYVLVEGGGRRKTFAAETIERAQAAAQAWIAENATRNDATHLRDPECGMGGDVGGTEPNPIPF